MTIFNQYPVFAANQVLRHDHLNDIVNYLEEQSRLTRIQTVGLGIVCGYRMSSGMAPDGNNVQRFALHLSEGVGITSKGYLASTPKMTFTGRKKYEVDDEISSLEGDIQQDKPYTQRIYLYRELAEIYPFFKLGNDLFPLYELVEDVASDDDAQSISPTFLEDKVLLLYIKQDLLSLKNCDTNDCNDSGAKLEMQVRFLLIDKNNADIIKERERDTQEAGKRPIHLSDHQKFSLQNADQIRLPKLELVNNPPNTFGQLAIQYSLRTQNALNELKEAIITTTQAYHYLLNSLYPPNIINLITQAFNSISNKLTTAGNGRSISIQQYYDFAAMLIDAYHEFHTKASEYDAMCNPSESHFPKHLMLGLLTDINKDLSNDFVVRSPFISTGSGFFPVEGQKVTYRHHFIPAPELQRQNILIEEIWTLHYRMIKMITTFDANLSIAGNPLLKIVPSKSKIHPLSERAIPIYLPVISDTNNTNDPLLRVWSYQRTTHNQLQQVHTYHRINNNNNPLRFRQDDEDFYRIEGLIGKPVDLALNQLIAERQRLGLDFGIQVIQLDNSLGSVHQIGRYVSLLKDFVKRHPGLEHQGGVPKGGTFIIAFHLSTSPLNQVVADFALSYNCCGSDLQHELLQECKYKWLSSAKYLRNIARPFMGRYITERNYWLTISRYEIEGVSLLGNSAIKIAVPMRAIKRSAMRAIVDQLNQRFPTGLVFDTAPEEDRFVIKKYAGQRFILEIRESGKPIYVYNEKGMYQQGDQDNTFYKEVECRLLAKDYNPSDYRLLHETLRRNQDYMLDFMLNTDWQLWTDFIEKRTPESMEDNVIGIIYNELIEIRDDVLAVAPRAEVYLVGSWANGSWVAHRTAENPAKFLMLREKLLGKTGISDIEIRIDLSTAVRGTADSVLANLKEYYGHYQVNVSFGKPSSRENSIKVEDII